jgi:BirA family transcriptional regulator, biotin operon repressor / biotin---[acetyl-CoA-carboxylase] ligase
VARLGDGLPMSYPPTQPLPDEFAEPLARAADRLGLFARQILWYADVASTNDLAATLAERGTPEGCVVVANAQSAGRGRQGRSWASPAGAGVYASAVLRPAEHALPLLTIAAGVAVADGIHAATGLVPDLKWPNDVFVGGRKVAGVLAEASSRVRADFQGVGAGLQIGPGGAIQYVVVGFGINVMPAAYPPEIAARATSLEGELGRSVDRGLLLAECLCSLAARYQDLERGRMNAVVEAWRARAASTLGRRVQWNAAGGALEGVAENIDDMGALVVRTKAGLTRVTAGEMRWV